MTGPISREEYIKKYWNDFYGQPDAKYPKREYQLKIGTPRCYDKSAKYNKNGEIKYDITYCGLFTRYAI